MRTIAAELPAGDGAAVFSQVYLRVTEMMLDRLTTGGVFYDDEFMAELDVGSPSSGSRRTTPPPTCLGPGRRCSRCGRTAASCRSSTHWPA